MCCIGCCSCVQTPSAVPNTLIAKCSAIEARVVQEFASIGRQVIEFPCKGQDAYVLNCSPPGSDVASVLQCSGMSAVHTTLDSKHFPLHP